MTRRLRAALFAASLPLAALVAAGPAAVAPAHAQTAPRERPSQDRAGETAAAARAIAAAERRDWATARAEAARHPLLLKLATWLELINSPRVAFDEAAAFLRANPAWPGQAALRRAAEEALTADVPDRAVLAWFADGEPRTVNGRMRLIAALMNAGRREEAVAYLRKTWVEGNFGADQEKDFLKLYRAHLRPQDFEARVDRLLWDGRGWEAERSLRYVDKGTQALAHARIQLRGMGSAADAAIRRVPKELLNDPGLVYERVRWRRIKERDADARELLAKPPKELVRPDAWFAERAILARRALRTGEASVAYGLVGKASAGTTGATLAESEWLAGWIALRFLGDPARAYGHFVRLHDNVRFPVSLARGAYWAGRAAEARGDAKLAEDWYGRAAQHVTTFYGQLAAAHLGRDLAKLVPAEPAPTATQRKAFAENELARAARLLAGAKDRRWSRAFVLALVEQAKTPEEQELVSELALELGRPDLAVSAAKFAVRRGVPLVATGYPVKDMPARAHGLERELLLAVMRQESAFDPDAVSSAGARGLMQLMPGTAREMARKTGLPYAQAKLHDANYNMTLGSRYLGGLIEDFGGSYVMAIAAYNAGPGRVRAWLRAYGDPRSGALDVVDWIELIPFGETRDYVQRVLENLQVYRTRTGETRVAMNLRQDLERAVNGNGNGRRVN